MTNYIKTLAGTEDGRAKIYVGSTFVILVIGIVTFLIEQAGIINLHCPIYTTTKFSCPACGVTRLVIALLDGKILQAFRWNPLIFTSIPYYVYLWYGCLKSYRACGRVIDKYSNQILMYAVVVISFGIIRNIPGFEMLLPTKI